MKHIFTTLGIEKFDGEVYLKLLELGPQSISVLAKSCNTPRSSMYVVIDRLQKVGLVEEFQRFSRKYVRAISPQEIENIFNKKKLEIEHWVEVLSKNMEYLTSLESQYSFKPIVNFYEWEQEVRSLYTRVLSYPSFQAIVSTWPFMEIFPDISESIQKKGIKIQEFIVPWDGANAYRETYGSSTHEIKELPEGYNLSSDTIITQDSVFMISFDGKQVLGFQIVSSSLIETQKILFESLWNSVQ